ncbi:SDR family oxidoreductase [Chondromyces crocatus]|nr:SDR family oxidoreductase [Chondromyces crocatus]
MNTEGIEGKVIAITGASRGIGEATARWLADRGAKVVLGARGAEPLERLTRQITERGGEAAFCTIDVRQRDDLSRFVAFACERFGRLDVLVSNAGIGLVSAFDELRVDDWDTMIDVNLRSVLYGIAAALPVFRKQGAGHFVHTASVSGIRIVPTQGVYAATKNAVRTLSEALRQEAGDALRVTVVSPGFVRTDFIASVPGEALRHQLQERARIAVSPEAIARAIAFAIEQPPEVDVGEIVVRPTAQD